MWVYMWFGSNVYVCMYLERVCVVDAACGWVVCVFQCCAGAGVARFSVLFDYSLKCKLAVNQTCLYEHSRHLSGETELRQIQRKVCPID